jgi:hypothetical protein
MTDMAKDASPRHRLSGRLRALRRPRAQPIEERLDRIEALLNPLEKHLAQIAPSVGGIEEKLRSLRAPSDEIDQHLAQIEALLERLGHLLEQALMATRDVVSAARVTDTHHFVRLGDWGNPTLAAAAAAFFDLVSHNAPAAVAVGITSELAQRYRHLTEDEWNVFSLLYGLAQNGSIYKVWIDQDRLLAAMDPELDLESRKRLLASMKSRGILEEGAGKWRAVW